MSIDSSWIDIELYEKIEPYLNLGDGYNVLLVQRTAIPVIAFTARCILEYSGGLNLIESFILRAAAEFSPTADELIDITALDADIAQYLIQSLLRRNLIKQNFQNALELTDTGRNLYQRLQTKETLEQDIVGCREILTGKIHLLKSADDLVPINDIDRRLISKKQENQFPVPSLDELQEVFINMTEADLYFGYNLLQAGIQKEPGDQGIPIGLLLIQDADTGKLHTKVFDLIQGRLNPDYDDYYDAYHLMKETELMNHEV